MVILLKAIMISGRTLGQGASCEAKMSTDFFKAVSVCSISEEDFGSLGMEKGGQVLVKSDFGQVVVSARAETGLPSGLVFIPMGPWANALVGADTGGCGTPQFKGVEVEIESTDQPVPNIQELFGDLGRVKS
jgi:formylmethanofuran dehydrogenase subunit D